MYTTSTKIKLIVFCSLFVFISVFLAKDYIDTNQPCGPAHSPDEKMRSELILKDRNTDEYEYKTNEFSMAAQGEYHPVIYKIKKEKEIDPHNINIIPLDKFDEIKDQCINPYLNQYTLESSDTAYIANGNYSIALQGDENSCQSCAIVNAYRWIKNKSFADMCMGTGKGCLSSKILYIYAKQYDSKRGRNPENKDDIGATFTAVDEILTDLQLPHYILYTNEANNSKEALDGISKTISANQVYIVGVDTAKFYEDNSLSGNHAIVLCDYNSTSNMFTVLDSNCETIYDISYEQLLDCVVFDDNASIIQIFN